MSSRQTVPFRQQPEKESGDQQGCLALEEGCATIGPRYGEDMDGNFSSCILLKKQRHAVYFWVDKTGDHSQTDEEMVEKEKVCGSCPDPHGLPTATSSPVRTLPARAHAY